MQRLEHNERTHARTNTRTHTIFQFVHIAASKGTISCFIMLVYPNAKLISILTTSVVLVGELEGELVGSFVGKIVGSMLGESVTPRITLTKPIQQGFALKTKKFLVIY